jgi:antitoxin (DNA-binding transcriptional repressor) of toxin-antitoxin stability system
MSEVSIRDLRNHGGEVVDRAAQGELVTITRDGKPVAELRALRRVPVPLAALLDGWSRLPRLDPRLLRADVDEVLDEAL